MNSRQSQIKTTVLCLPVINLDCSLTFYRNVFGYHDATIEDGIIALELPNLSLFLMGKAAFEIYSQKVGRLAQFPGTAAGLILSCAMESAEAVDAMMNAASSHGGSTHGNAEVDETYGGYTGYLIDPDGYLWELVHPPHQ